jgi:RNA polymerase sigma-70 factor (ECF subfamily)
MSTILEKQRLLIQAYKDYKRNLYIHAYFKISNKQTSEDLVQETFTKTWKYLLKGGKIDILKAFLYHILNNLIVDQYRKRKNTSLDLLLEKGYEPSINKSENLNNILDGKAALLLIQYLPKKYRLVIHMRYVQLLSLKEISKLTDQHINTVAVQIHRGLKKLKELVNPK